MSFQPNRLVLESGHRLVVEHFSRLPGMRLLLRPARKRLFAQEPRIPSLQVELSKPAFAVLVAEDDVDARPVLIFETDSISAGIRDLYRNADLPCVEADQMGGRGMLRFERPGFSAKLQFDDRGDTQAVESVIRWAETAPLEPKGNLVRNEVERSVADAIGEFAEELGICVHHQVPFGYAAGYRQDLPRLIARHTIELSVSVRPEIDPEAPVVLPIRVELRPESERDPEGVEKDQHVADFVCSVGMPMAAIQPAEGDTLRITYSLDGHDDILVSPNDADEWRSVLRSLAESALEATGTAVAKT